MKNFVVIVLAVIAIGYVAYKLFIPDFVEVNRQMVEQCSIDKGICD